ncbi:perlucin-like protein [Macrobrachium nipponense]|uniref:perlucin-like protein n=1 Tax=Macrobrachium nipponense TaxID=159736 RepID=UPI0030C8B173
MMKALALIFGAFLISGASCVQCEDGWVEIQGSCFRFHQDVAMPWQDAVIFCQDVGAHLAIVVDSDAHRSFYEYILTYGLSGTYWLGGSDLAYEGDWKWAKDESRIPRGTPFWALHSSILGWTHEPTGGSAENCLGLDSARKYYFNDLDCNLIHHPICMK